MSNEQAVERWRGEVHRLMWLRLGVRLSVAYTFVWGVAALVVRALVEGGANGLWWGGLGLIAVWIVAGWWARRRVPAAAQTRALFDRENRLGGLLMVHDAEGIESWTSDSRRVDVPRVRWRGGPSGWAMLGAAVFVLAAMLVPMPRTSQAHGALDVSRSVSAMEQQVQVLEEEQIFESPEADQVRDAMKRIGDQAKGDDPSKTWEALDHLAEQIEQAADEAVELAQRRMDEAAGAEALSQALEQGAGSLSAERLGEAMNTLAELSKAAAGSPTLDGMTLPPELAQALSENGLDVSMLDAEMLQQLAESMAGRQAELQEMIESLAEAGLCEGGGSGAGDGLAAIDPAELLDWLSGDGECDAQGLMAVCQGLKAGRGGISRGPGHAEMIWKDPASQEGVAFDPELLPPSRMREVRDAQLIGTSRGTPQEDADAAASSGGALTGASAGGGSAAEVTVLPRHRGAVQRYFDRASQETE